MKTAYKLLAAVSALAALTACVGLFLQSRKADIDSAPAEKFDSIMDMYYVGTSLITAALWTLLAYALIFAALYIIGRLVRK